MSTIRGLLRLAVLAAAIGVAFAESVTPPPPRSLEVPEGALVAPGKAAELELMFTGDVIGYIEDCGCKLNPAGGLSRRAWLLNRVKTNYPGTPVVLLDSGNFSDNPTEAGEIRTQALLDAMVSMGYKAVNVGDRDLTLGYEDFHKRISGVDMAFISTNIVKQGTNETVFPSSTVVEVKGTSGKPVRIGVMGVLRYSPVWQKAGPEGTNLAVAQPAEMIKAVLPELRAKSDVVVLLASLSKEDAHELAKQFQDIDLVLGTYGGIYNAVEENEGRVKIYYSGNQGKRVGESRVNFDAKRKPSDITTYMHFLTARYPDDKPMHDVVAAVTAKLPKGDQPEKPQVGQKIQIAPPGPGGQ